MPAKDAPGMRAACLRETAVKMNRRRVVVRAVLKNARLKRVTE